MDTSKAFGSDAAGWLCEGLAYRLALDLGVNIDASLAGSNVVPHWEVELRRRIYWSLYCDDKLAAAYTGRVSTVLVSRLCLISLFTDLPYLPHA